MIHLLIAIGSLFVDQAHAIATLPVHCDGLVGCGGAPANLFKEGIPKVALYVLQIAAGLSVVSIVWAGLQMTISWGDTGKIDQAKNAILYALFGLGLSVLSQYIISSVISQLPTIPDNASTLHLDILKGIADYLRNILNATLALAVAYGAIRMVMAQGKQDEFQKGRTAIIWAVIGAIVVNFAVSIASIVSGILGV